MHCESFGACHRHRQQQRIGKKPSVCSDRQAGWSKPRARFWPRNECGSSSFVDVLFRRNASSLGLCVSGTFALSFVSISRPFLFRCRTNVLSVFCSLVCGAPAAKEPPELV
ncbi:unnamed protein product [Scytosiphon promiscuus]